MTMGTLAAFALGVIVWFGLAFGTGSWIRQWIAALIAGFAMAWWRYPAMEEVAATVGLAPMSFARFAAISMAGMMLIASAGMGLYWLLQKSRRAA